MVFISAGVMRGIISPLFSLAPASMCSVALGWLVLMPTIPFVVCALTAIPDSNNAINNTLFIILNLIVIYSVIYIDV